MPRTIEIFTIGSKTEEKVGCSSCPKSCSSRDEAVLTSEVLYNQLLAMYGSDMEITLHDYESGDQEAILKRQNEIYKGLGIKRIVNKVLVGPLAKKIWPSVVIDGDIKSEGVILDLSRIDALLKVQ